MAICLASGVGLQKDTPSVEEKPIAFAVFLVLQHKKRLGGLQTLWHGTASEAAAVSSNTSLL